MQGVTIGAGLAALGFWGFIAAVAVAAIWAENRKREARHETLRRMLESGQPIDQDLMDKLLAASGGSGSKRLARDLKIAGLIVSFVAPGLALFGWLLGIEHGGWTLPIVGVAALVGCIGIGLLAAAMVLQRWREER